MAGEIGVRIEHQDLAPGMKVVLVGDNEHLSGTVEAIPGTLVSPVSPGQPPQSSDVYMIYPPVEPSGRRNAIRVISPRGIGSVAFYRHPEAS